MNESKKHFEYNFFIYFSLFWITVGWGAYLLALAGFFYWWSLSILIALAFAFIARFIFRNLLQASSFFIAANIFFVAVSIFFVYFSAPTIFSGRDQASISQAAIRLSQNGQLEFQTSVSQDFFQINNIQEDKTKNCLIDNLNDFQNTNFFKTAFYKTYCQAASATQAYNFPGFYYTQDGNLITQFPIAYIAYLAIFYSFAGVFGFTLANGILIYFFLLAFYLTIEKLSAQTFPPLPQGEGRGEGESKSFPLSFKARVNYFKILSIAIITISFCLMWFSKFTLTENMAAPLLWIGIFSALLLVKPEKKINRTNILILFFLSFGLLIFTRIEGLAFFIFASAALLLNKSARKYFQKNWLKIILFFLLPLILIFIWNFLVDIYFYKSILKAALSNFTQSASDDITASNNLLSILNLFKIFWIYGLLIPLILGATCIAYFIKKKNFSDLIPFLIILPSLLYIINPQITPDHPWMLRRFAFSVIPAFTLYSLLLIELLLKKKRFISSGLAFSFLIFFSAIPFFKFLTFIPGENLFEETKKLSQNFSAQDLALVDQLASGDKYSMLADPLNSVFSKNAVYFFNPQDLSKIDLTKYERVYLIAPAAKENYYHQTLGKEKLNLVQNYSITSNTLQSDSPFNLPQKGTRAIDGKIFEILP